MAVVLSYCPSGKNSMSVPRNGIELLSDHIYTELKRIFPTEEIVYLNFQDKTSFRKLKGLPVSHLFGISTNFNKYVRLLKPEKSCLIAVNEHALFRRTIRDLSKRKNLPKSSRDPHDGYFSNLFETSRANFVLGIGSWSMLQSYRQRGIVTERVFITGYPYWQDRVRIDIKEHYRKILMFPGYICTRKGAEFIEPLVKYLHEHYPEFTLRVVGFTAYSDWGIRIKNLADKYPNQLEFLETRIDFGSKEWLDLATDTAFAIFPSHEEGLAGCALDTMNLGIPLIHSSKVGIEYQHECLSNVDFEGDRWKDGLSNIIRGGSQLWNEIARHQRDASFHLSQSYSGIAKGLERVAQNRIWPNIDLGNIDFIPDSLRFLTDPRKPFDYIYRGNKQKNHINLSHVNHTPNSVDVLLSSILILEKYTNFDSISLSSSPDHAVVLSRARLFPRTASAEITLQIREYFPIEFTSAPLKHQILRLHLRELLFTTINKTTYSIRRGLNILKLKLIVESNKVLRKIGDGYEE